MDYRQEFENRMMAKLCGIPEGRYLVGLLLEESGFFRNSARDAGSSDDVFFSEGERNVGQRVFELAVKAGADPLQCMKEYGEQCRTVNELQYRADAEELNREDVTINGRGRSN